MPPAPIRLLAAAIAIIAALGVAAAPASAAACPYATTTADRASADQLEKALLCLMNQARRKRGVRALRRNADLDRASLRHTLDMIGSLLFSHSGSDGDDVVDRVRRTGYLRGARRWRVGENIAYGYGSVSAPREIMRMLMRSREHRRNILYKGFREVGVGVERGTPLRKYNREGATYTTDFGVVRE